MNASVKAQIYRLLVIYSLLAALVAWQRHFIMVGIESNPYLNLLIIGVFLFGSLHGIISIVALGNEGKALAALREAYDDAVRAEELAALDPLWREKRCFEPAILFRRPRLLDSVYDLALDEIRRARTMRISVETMQTLLHAVDRRIVTDRALLGYLSGLCIFLGLIGTFIGLMEMVGSVGSIIGGVASADSGSPEAIKGLIRDLEAPLKGMATGFSASLFGLFSSLVLGLTARFGAQATNGLRNELEAWLGAMSRIESERETVAHRAGVDDQTVARFGGLALTVMGGMQRTGQLVGRAADAIRALADRQSEQGVVLGRILADLGTVARQHRELRETLDRTTSVQQSLLETRGEIRTGFDGLAQRIDGASSRLAEAIGESGGQVVSLVGAVAERQGEALRQSLAAAQAQEDGFRRLELAQAGARLEQQQSLVALGNGLGTLQAAVADVGLQTSTAIRRLDEGLAGLGRTAEALVERQQRDAGLLLAGVQRLDTRLEEQAVQRQAGESAVQAGLGQLAGAISETAGALQGRFDRQTHDSRETTAQVSSLRELVSSLAGVLEQNLARDAGERASAAEVQQAAMGRLADHQAEIGRVLVALAGVWQTQRTGLDAELREAIGAGFGQLSDALVESQAALARTLAEASTTASGEAGLTELAGTLRAELRDLRVALERGLASGFDEVRGAMSQTLDGLSQLGSASGQDSPSQAHSELDDEIAPIRRTRDIEALRRIALRAANGR